MILDGGQEDFEEAWRVFTYLEAVEWKHLPYAGGLMDQPDVLMKNVFRIKSQYGRLKEQQKDVTQ